MWKLFNYLFDWQYALVTFGTSYEVVRVVEGVTGVRYYTCYGNTYEVPSNIKMLTFKQEENMDGNN